jgi:hypothetical protein
MLKKLASFLAGLLVLAIAAGIIYALYIGFTKAVALFASLDRTVAAALIAASATVIVSVVSVVFGNLYVYRLRVRRETRSKKIPVYEALLEFMFRFLGASEKKPAPTEDEGREFMVKFNREFMVWGDDRVVAAWVKWRKHAGTPNADPKETMFLIEDLIRTIRRDVSHRNRGLIEGDLLAIFINDIDTVLPRRSPR